MRICSMRVESSCVDTMLHFECHRHTRVTLRVAVLLAVKLINSIVRICEEVSMCYVIHCCRAAVLPGGKTFSG